jgi:regulator of sigma E protease
MNFILAILVFAALNFTEGKTMAATTTVGPIPETSPAVAAGLREGDRITAINGDPVAHFEEIGREIYIDHGSEDITLSVEREGAPMTITIPRNKIPEQSIELPVIPYSNFHYVEIKNVVGATPAEKAGLKPGDRITRADGSTITTVSELIQHIGEHKDRVISLELVRGGSTVFVPVKPNDEGKIGAELSGYNGPIDTLSYGFGEAFSAGWDETMAVTAGTFGLVGKLVTGDAKLKDSVGGPAMIASVAQQTASRGLADFLKLMGVLSVTLACMNILPIPALDGGHLVFIIIEGVIRREVPLKIRMAIQQVGFALLIIFMAFVLYNDTARLIGN